MKNIYLLKNSEYGRLGEKATYILDSNIVISLRDLFYKPQKIKKEDMEEIEELLKLLRNNHVIDGIGVTECSWNFQEFNQDDTKAERIKYALDLLLEYDEEHLKRVFRDLEETTCPQHNPISKGKRVCGNLNDNAEINYMMLPTIAVFLKFYQLLEGNVERIKEGLLAVQERRNIYKEVIKFVDLEMHFVPAYEVWCITEILFNNDENRDKILELLKLKGKASKGKQIREKVWNAGWDIFFMRILSESTLRYIRGEMLDNWSVHNPILVTKDKNLYEIGNESMTGGGAGIKYINGEMEVGLDLEFPNISDEDYEFIEDMMWGVEQNKELRLKFMKEANFVEHFKGIVKKLEIELNL